MPFPLKSLKSSFGQFMETLTCIKTALLKCRVDLVHLLFKRNKIDFCNEDDNRKHFLPPEVFSS